MKNILLYTTCFLFVLCTSCTKYLDKKQNKQLVIASSIQDAQAILDNQNVFYNYYNSDGTSMDDDFYLTSDVYASLDVISQNQYVWSKDASIYDNAYPLAYYAILYTNTALSTLDRIAPSSTELASYNLAKGMALFLRAHAHHQLALLFCLQYDSNASQHLGVVYKTSDNINDPSVRSNLFDSYKFILADLKEALILLPKTTSFPSRPNKAAAYGEIARVYLSMADYANAKLYADSSLQLNSSLMDFNNYDPSSSAPFPKFNVETSFSASSFANSNTYVDYWNCDSNLYASYDSLDLRKGLYFVQNANGINTYAFKGNYNEGAPYEGPFNGVATDEMFLIRAEGFARSGNISSAMNDLNTLLQKRYKANKFIPLVATDATNALDIILTERRKELVWRCNVRWMDLKRLNLESRYQKTLKRIINGTTYTLPPNDLRYALLLPPSVINLSGIPQNPR